MGQIAVSLMRRPQRHHRIIRAQDTQRGVTSRAKRRQLFRIRQRAGDPRRGYRVGVGGMKRPNAQPLQPGHVGQVGHASGWLEPFDEGWKSCPVLRQQDGIGWRGPHEKSGHRPEKRLSHQFQCHGKGVGQRIDQGDYDIVAINGEAPGWIGAVPGGQSRRAGRVGIEQGGGEKPLIAHTETSSRSRCADPIHRSAHWTSASRTDSGGMS